MSEHYNKLTTALAYVLHAAGQMQDFAAAFATLGNENLAGQLFDLAEGLAKQEKDILAIFEQIQAERLNDAKATSHAILGAAIAGCIVGKEENDDRS